MPRIYKPGKVAIVLQGRQAGKKVVVIKQLDEGTKERPYPHAIVAGIERYPLKVTKRMGAKKVAKRSKIKPFIKVVNYSHLFPTRYAIELEGLKGVVSQDTFKEVSQREDSKKQIKKLLEDKYQGGKNKWFFQPLRYAMGDNTGLCALFDLVLRDGPYYYLREPFTNKADFWAANCAANDEKNGLDFKNHAQMSKISAHKAKKLAKASIVQDVGPTESAVGLLSQFQPSLPSVPGSEGVIKSYILPDNKTGVMLVGSFEPDDFDQFQTDVQDTFTQFQAAGLTQLIVDLTNDGGGFVCLGHSCP